MGKMKKMVAMLLAVCMVVSMCPMSSEAASTKGPDLSKGNNSFICVYKAKDKDWHNLYYPAYPKTVEKVSGITYSKKTNTLTIKNVNKPSDKLSINTMGSDFKIKVVGKNSLSSILVWGYGYNGSVEFTGDGTLELNKNKKIDTTGVESVPLLLQAENSPSVLKVGKKVTLKCYASKKDVTSVAILMDSVKTKSKVIKFMNGASIKKFTSSKNENLVREDFAIVERTEDSETKMTTTGIKLTKKGDTNVYVAKQIYVDGKTKYQIYKLTDEEFSGRKVGEFVEMVADYKKAGYASKLDFITYNYYYKGNLVLKGK
ncbi:MAG: hypothetical protein Q4D51_06500 [Eubacteriales bacterium]|nr:hypothetical protein [Eubacteriales bacterium]